jgi:hypothetical protein
MPGQIEHEASEVGRKVRDLQFPIIACAGKAMDKQEFRCPITREAVETAFSDGSGRHRSGPSRRDQVTDRPPSTAMISPVT